MSYRITDYLSHFRVQDMIDPMFTIVNAQQSIDGPGRALGALVMALRVECQALNLDLSEVLQYAGNAIGHMNELETEQLKAVAEYVKNEIGGGS